MGVRRERGWLALQMGVPAFGFALIVMSVSAASDVAVMDQIFELETIFRLAFGDIYLSMQDMTGKPL